MAMAERLPVHWQSNVEVDEEILKGRTRLEERKAPPLMLLMVLMANNRALMGERVNSRLTNVLGWITVVANFSASIELVATCSSEPARTFPTAVEAT
jgi:hypothetical protein